MKTITVKDETHARLRRVGVMGESFDDVINRLISLYEHWDGSIEECAKNG